MRFIPEYSPARKLTLSYVDDFYNTLFHYGKAHAQIIRACRELPVEMYMEPSEMEAFRAAVGEEVLALPHLTFNPVSPRTAIMLEGAPIFAENEDGDRIGLAFRTRKLQDPDAVFRFSRWFAEQNGFTPYELDFDFSAAKLLVNEDLVLLSAEQFQTAEDERKLRFFQDHFPGYDFQIVTPLHGDTTCDLDMYLWPIAPRVWIVSQYPAGSAEEQSIAPALERLADHGHTVHRVPGLKHLLYDDIDTMPNYANGILLNRLALVPAYGLKEDFVVVDILRGYGITVEQIDCSDIILSNSAIHCISTVVPG
jgi:hypothetical protein